MWTEAVFEAHHCSLACVPPIHEQALLVAPVGVPPAQVKVLIAQAIPELRVVALQRVPDAGLAVKARIAQYTQQHYVAQTATGQIPADVTGRLEAMDVWLVLDVAVLPTA